MSKILLVCTNVPDEQTADTLARELVERRLAACVSAGQPVTSTYRWEGKIEQAAEIALQIKTTTDRYAAVQQLIGEMHPYELPEIIAIPVEQGLPGYLDWITEETGPD